MNIIDFNHCNLPKCKCGWNLTIGGTDEKELKELKKLLKTKWKYLVADLTHYEHKINPEKFF